MAGVGGGREGREYYGVTVSIDREGRWHAAIHILPDNEGMLTLVYGDVQGLLARVSNRAGLTELDGHEYLTLFDPTGVVWGESERASLSSPR
jgi:hypothetical protein